MDEKTAGLFFKKGDLTKDEKGDVTGLTFELDPRNFILFNLQMLTSSPNVKEEDKPGIIEAYKYLSEHLGDVEIKLNEKVSGVDITFNCNGGDEAKERIELYFKSYKYVYEILKYIVNKYREQIAEAKKRKAEAKKEKQAKQKKKEKLRSGGHLIDNILKSNKPKDNQLSIFDTMLQDTKNKVISSGVKPEMVNRKGEGIKITKGEFKLLLSLQALLHEKSQTNNPKGEDYYSGNQGSDLIVYNPPEGGEITLKSPRLSFTLYEIAKEYYGGADIGGENVKTVAKILYDIAEDPEKKALIRYHKLVEMGKGKEREYFIEKYDSLVSIATAGYKDFIEGKQIDEKKEIVINLHPVFIDQIATKYIEMPLDITRRMIEANGSQNISDITLKLVYELARAHSNRKRLPKDEDKNPLYTIGQYNLYYKIAETYMPPYQRRLPLIKKYLAQAIETAKNIGLLLSYETKPGVTGEQNYIFTLSKNWE